MRQEKIQSKSEQQQALAMARRVLGQAKEMKLNSDQHKKMMGMIDKARGFEVTGETQKALHVYLALKTYLEEIKNGPKFTFSGVADRTKDNHEVLLFFDEELEKSKAFYENEGVDWVEFPEQIIITQSQEAEMKRCIREFSFNKIMIIPAGLAVDADEMNILHSLMGRLYPPTKYNPNYTKYAGTKILEKRQNLRIVLYRNQKGLDDLYLQTRGKSAEELMAPGGLMDTLGLEGLSEAEFLVLQHQHFLDFPADYMYMGDEVMLLGSNFMKTDEGHEMAVSAYWDLSGTHSPKGLVFDGRPKNMLGSGVGCPLVKTFEIKD